MSTLFCEYIRVTAFWFLNLSQLIVHNTVIWTANARNTNTRRNCVYSHSCLTLVMWYNTYYRYILYIYNILMGLISSKINSRAHTTDPKQFRVWLAVYIMYILCYNVIIYWRWTNAISTEKDESASRVSSRLRSAECD